MSEWQDAIAAKKLRVYWNAPAAPKLPSQDALMPALWAAMRQKKDAPGQSQDEDLEVIAIDTTDGGFRVRVRYMFDYDFASQYDQTERFEGEILLDGKGGLAGIARWDALDD